MCERAEVCIWPDGTWIHKYEVSHFWWKSSGYVTKVVPDALIGDGFDAEAFKKWVDGVAEDLRYG